jgi:hypothetical protein
VILIIQIEAMPPGAHGRLRSHGLRSQGLRSDRYRSHGFRSQGLSHKLLSCLTTEYPIILI